MITTRPLLGRTGTAVAGLVRAARTTPAPAATANRGAADHSVTVIATRDGRPMAVAVDSRARRATTAADATTDAKDGGAAAAPARGPAPRQPLGTLHGPGGPCAVRATAPRVARPLSCT